MQEHLPKSKATVKPLEETAAFNSLTQKAFSQLITQLENDGWCKGCSFRWKNGSYRKMYIQVLNL